MKLTMDQTQVTQCASSTFHTLMNATSTKCQRIDKN